jgi:hypothetical protein
MVAINVALAGSTTSSSELSGGSVSVRRTTNSSTGTTTSVEATEYYDCHNGWGGEVKVRYVYFTAPEQSLVPNGTVMGISTPWYILYLRSFRVIWRKSSASRRWMSLHIVVG